MIEIIGDFWDVFDDYDAIVCTTNLVQKSNGELVMGAGIAKEFARRFSWLPAEWGQTPGFQCSFFDSRVNGNLIFAIAYPTKHHWKDPSDIHLILDSARNLKKLTDWFRWEKVLMPRPGCGCGGLEWEDIKDLLMPILDDRFYVISK